MACICLSRSVIIYFSFATALVLLDSVVQSLSLLEECAVLRNFYLSCDTSGSYFEWNDNAGWGSANISNCCDPDNPWYGVTCDSLNQHVTEINLPSNNLCCDSLPDAFGNLSQLTYLDMSSNTVSGSIPASWGSLTNLTYLALADQRVQGPLPPELGGMSSLVSLLIGNNEIYGTLPPEWRHMTSLRTIDVSLNHITGSLPPEWASMTSLDSIDVSENNIIGTIPPEWCFLPISSFICNTNKMVGALPASWRSMRTTLTVLDLSQNEFNGSLPMEWSELAKLESLHLNQNRLTGSLPPEWHAMSALTDLKLFENELEGSLPHEWSNFSVLESLDARNNKLVGKLPKLWSTKNLFLLALSYNQIESELHAEWMTLPMVFLILNNNKLYGTLPMEWANWSVTFLDLANNNLTGTIPLQWVQPDSSMFLAPQFLILAGNPITGSIPNISRSFSALWLQRTSLEGPLPPLIDAQEIDVEGTAIEGDVCCSGAVSAIYAARSMIRGIGCRMENVKRLVLDEANVTSLPLNIKELLPKLQVFSARNLLLRQPVPSFMDGTLLFLDLSGNVWTTQLSSFAMSSTTTQGKPHATFLDLTPGGELGSLRTSAAFLNCNQGQGECLQPTSAYSAQSSVGSLYWQQVAEYQFDCLQKVIFPFLNMNYSSVATSIVGFVIRSEVDRFDFSTNIISVAVLPILREVGYLGGSLATNAEPIHAPWNNSAFLVPPSASGSISFDKLPTTQFIFGVKYSLTCIIVAYGSKGVNDCRQEYNYTIPVARSFEAAPCDASLFGVPWTTTCKACPDNADCNGTATISIDDGYWRPSAALLPVYPCTTCGPSPAGGGRVGYECLEGYVGPVCAVCAAGYGLNGAHCSKCASTAANISVLVLLIILALGYLTFAVYDSAWMCHRAFLSEQQHELAHQFVPDDGALLPDGSLERFGSTRLQLDPKGRNSAASTEASFSVKLVAPEQNLYDTDESEDITTAARPYAERRKMSALDKVKNRLQVTKNAFKRHWLSKYVNGITLKLFNNHMSLYGLLVHTAAFGSLRADFRQALSLSETASAPGTSPLAAVSCLFPSLTPEWKLLVMIAAWPAIVLFEMIFLRIKTKTFLPVSVATCVVQLMYAALLQAAVNALQYQTFHFYSVTPFVIQGPGRTPAVLTFRLLDADRRQDVGEDSTVLYLGGLLLAVLTIAVPASLCVMYRIMSSSQGAEAANRKLHFLVGNYKPNRWFWEMVIMVRKSLCLAAVLSLRSYPAAQLTALASVVMIYLALHEVCDPHVSASSRTGERLTCSGMLIATNLLVIADSVGGNELFIGVGLAEILIQVAALGGLFLSFYRTVNHATEGVTTSSSSSFASADATSELSHIEPVPCRTVGRGHRIEYIDEDARYE